MFTPEEIDRYKRHLVLRDVGGAGQQALKSASVLLVGAGGLGSPIALYLAAAGLGRIGIIDDDVVSLDNLQRQIVHDTPRVGMAKVESAHETVARLNPHVTVEPINARLTAENALHVIGDYDIVVDGSDNFATRYLVSDACFFAERPLVFGAVGPFDGYVSTFKPYQKRKDGTHNPTYRCLFPEAPEGEAALNCSEVGVLGSVVGVIGTLQATEVIKEVIGIGDSLVGRLLIYDALATRFDTFTYQWDKTNPLSGTGRRYRDLRHHLAAESSPQGCTAPA
ncbi:MAG: molybdopterin-synthase adenylyltransferase MoeB [Pseudomonadota bacterium]